MNSPQKFRKRPVVIEAMLWLGGADAAGPVIDWILAGGTNAEYHDDNDYGADEIAIGTLEGVMYASPGDWVIRGVKSEHYACKPDIFEATYEAAGDE